MAFWFHKKTALRTHGIPPASLSADGDFIVCISSADAEKKDRLRSPILKLRRSLRVLKEGEEVLARWSDDGWYYNGT